MYTVTVDKKDEAIKIVNNETGNIITPYTEEYTGVSDYEQAGVIPIEPMSAKEYLNDHELEKMLSSQQYYAEEKFDGVRATFHLSHKGFNRLFSRRISKATGWYAENTDSLPHLRDLQIPE